MSAEAGSQRELIQFVAGRTAEEVRLHLGCGGVRWQDFINVDFYPFDEERPDSSRTGCVADYYADITALGLPDNSVAEIFTSHTVEHFPRWTAIDTLRDWHRILMPGGKLHIETPDFWRCVVWLFHPSARRRELARAMFYGNQWDRLEFETHRYLFSLGELTKVMRRLGYRVTCADHRSETHVSGRDMRVVALK